MPKDVNNVGSTNANKIFDLPLHLQPGQVNTLSFSQDSISSMQMTAKGELEISFRDGSKVAIADFNELADSAKSCGRDTLIQLSDNTIIYPDQLRDQLAQKGGVDFTAQNDGVITLDEPKAGQIVTKNIDAGHEYKLGFTLDGVNAAQSGHNLLLTFKDGGVLVLNNYFTAVNSDLPPAMTLADGATIDSNALLTSCKLVEVPNAAEAVLASNEASDSVQSGIRQSTPGAPDVEPAAGEEGGSSARAAARDTANAKQANGADVANIEPAAGDGVGLPGSSRGYGFGSSIEGASFRGATAIGPIAATSLDYTAPDLTPPFVFGTPADDRPSLGAAIGAVDETHMGSVSGVVNVDYGRDNPGALTLNSNFSSQYALTSHGVPVVVTLVGNTYAGTANGVPVFTLTLNPSTGAYTFTQLSALDHANPNNPDDSVGLVFGVTATDRDGDTGTTTITINVHDDGPVAVDDGAFIGNNQLNVGGNVLTNDNAGADGLGHVTTVSFNGTDYTVPAVGTVSITGTYGTLTIGADGTFNYVSSNTALGTDKFTYTMVDYDGDPSTANLILEVRDLDTTPLVADGNSILDETGVAPDGTESVTGIVSVEYYGDGPGKVDATGTFSSTGSQLGGALTSHGVPIVVTMAGDVYTGTANGKVIFTLTINDDGTYKYTQVGALDHADGKNPDDVITLHFGFTATDADGDHANGTINVQVLDDAPVAVNDGAYVGNNQLTVNGNVLTNDHAGTDGLGHVTSVSFNGAEHAVPANGTLVLSGTYGTLTIAADGTYNYVSSNTALGTDKFTYTMVDYDGDPSTANLTLEVRDLDTVPCVTNAESTIDETGITPDGTESISGHVTVDFYADGPGNVDPNGSFASGGSLKGGALTSNGVPVTVTMNGDVYTGMAGGKVVFTLTLNNDGSYTYTQVAGLDHADGANPNDVINLQFGFTATDADGDHANGVITVNVLDDAPTAANDFATLDRAPGTVTGNVTSNDHVGTDTPGYVVKAVSFEGTTVNVPATGTITIAGAHGTLTISATGAYSYTGTTTGSDVFKYTIVDQDGDPASANLTITVNHENHVPCITNAEITLDETGIAPDGTESVSGHVSVDYMGDGPGHVDPNGSFASGGSLKGGALTSNGVPVTVTMNGDVYTGMAGGKVVFTLTLNNDGSYTYTQVAGLDHADGANPNDVINLQFGFTATDADGDHANGVITVNVLDDAPIAHDDTFTNVTKLVTGNVLTNDYQGTDAPAPVIKVTLNGHDYPVAATGSTTIVGEHGTLVIKADGSYTYAPTHAGSDDFTYTIKDYDGDQSSAHLGFTVKDTVAVDVSINNDAGNLCLKEDHSVVVPVSANVTGGDGNEVVTLTLTGVASNWHFTAAGWTQVSPGTYQITLPAGQTHYDGNFTFAPPANSDVDLTGMKITASVFDPDMNATKTDESNFSVFVDAVADVPNLSITLPVNSNDDPRWPVASYNYKFYGHGEAYDFTFHATPTDTDGSEKITYYTIEMHPSLAALGVKFSAGTEISPGLWRIDAGQEIGLKILFPEVHGPDGNPWTDPTYSAIQGIHTMNITAYVEEVNLSGNECDPSDNTNFICTPVQVVILSSPLVIDLNHDGIHLTNVNDGVYFDINGDGVKDKTGWVDQHDGLLALDKNHNGQIDGQSELFGGNSEDGYAVLARYDDNHDGVIDSKDAVWKDLTVWQDANHNGVTDKGELISVDTLNFASISLDAKAVNYNNAGNEISAESVITNHDGTQVQMADAWFQFYNGADPTQMAEAHANEAAQAATVKVAPDILVSETPVDGGAVHIDPIKVTTTGFEPINTPVDAPYHNPIKVAPDILVADTPGVAQPVPQQPVLIENFDSKVDKIDLSSLIDTNTCAVTNAINEFVFSRTENGHTVISVDSTGSGSASAAVDVVVLKDVLVSHVDDIVQMAHQQNQQSGFGTV